MLIALSWENYAHEGGTFAAVMVAFACVAYLTRNWVRRSRNHELLERGIAMGLVPGQVAAGQRRRFSLRDLLVWVTLVAALAGVWIGMAGEEKNGIPGFRLWNEIHRLSDPANK